jgi:threonine/homoserine/homoserine lactone efflux protein
LLSDGPIALLVLLVLGYLPATAQQALRAAGGLLLLFLAWSTMKTFDAARETSASPGDAAPRTLLQAASVNLLNPNPWLAWALVLGPAVVSAWKQGPAIAVAFVAAFYGILVTGLGLFILAAGTARFLPPRARRTLVALSAAVLAAFGAWQLFASFRAIVRA